MGLTLDSVETPDGAPLAPPYRISAQPGHDGVEVLFTPTLVTEVNAWRVTFNGNRKEGLVLEKRGLVCGIGDRCGPGSRSLSTAPDQIVSQFDYEDTQPAADGEYPVEVNVHADGGWQ